MANPNPNLTGPSTPHYGNYPKNSGSSSLGEYTFTSVIFLPLAIVSAMTKQP